MSKGTGVSLLLDLIRKEAESAGLDTSSALCLRCGKNPRHKDDTSRGWLQCGECLTKSRKP